MLAKYNAKARVPEVLGIYRVGANSYAMATEMIDSTGLDKMEPKDISDKTLDDIWVQIKKLHQHNIIHKDLRAANVMVQNRTGMPWIIDFGFSECAVQPKSFYKDNVEFIASSATKVGARRAVAASRRALTQKSLAQALPYMQYAALSGATTTDLKLNKGLIEDIRKEMLDSTDIDSNGVAKAKISRISYPKKFTSK
jgi:undecaprenyl-diphosphatase